MPDAIVAPGVDLAAHGQSDTPPALLDAARRRRCVEQGTVPLVN
ncbi:hypothetical protein [Micromonospora sp. NPDC005203]